MEAIEASLSEDMRKIGLFLSKATKLSTLWAEILAPMGLHPVGRMLADGTYRIALVRTEPALESAALVSVGTDDLSMTRPAEASSQPSRIITEIRAEYLWDAAAEEPTEGAVVTIRNNDALAMYTKKQALEWRLVGRGWANPTQILTSWAIAVFQRFGSPYEILTLNVGRKGLLLQPGDSIELTLPGWPTASGGRGLTAQLARVLQVARIWSGEEPGAQVTVAIERRLRQSAYVPCGRILYSFDDGNPGEWAIQTEDGYYGDNATYAAGDKVWIYERPGGTRAMRTVVVQYSATYISVDSDPGITVTDHSFVCHADYSDASAAQRKFVYMADTTPILGASPTAAFRYV
jgi:hypothetical protein